MVRAAATAAQSSAPAPTATSAGVAATSGGDATPITVGVEAKRRTVPAPPLPAEAFRRATAVFPRWVRAFGWAGVAALIYLLVCAVSIISRGFAGLSGEVAHSLFAFADNPWVGLFVGVLGTVLIQSSTTTTAIAVTAVGAGALPLSSAVPIIMGANVGTTVTTTLIALGYIRNHAEFRRALEASSIHDFYNWLALLIFLPIELIWQPLQRASGALTELLADTIGLLEPGHFNLIQWLTHPVVRTVTRATFSINGGLGALLAIVIGAALIFVAVKYLSKLLSLLMVGRARDILTRAAGRNPGAALATGVGVTALTQSSTITTSVLIPFAGNGVLTSKQLYPITVGANIGTTFTVVFAAFAIVGQNAEIGLQAALVHLLYNLAALVVVYLIPVLRPIPLWCAEALARVASERRWVIALYLIGLYVVIPALVIVLVGVL